MRFYNKERKSLRTNTCYISLNIFWTALRHITINKGDCSRGENLNFCVRENFLTVWDPKRTYSLALSFQFIHSIMSNSLQHHGLQHARLPCPSQIPGACSNSCPLSQWCHPTISSSVAPSPPAFNLSQHQGLFQGVSSLHQVAKILGASASASVLPMNIQDWFLDIAYCNEGIWAGGTLHDNFDIAALTSSDLVEFISLQNIINSKLHLFLR